MDGQSVKSALSLNDCQRFEPLHCACLNDGILKADAVDRLFRGNRADSDGLINVRFYPYVFRARVEHTASKETISPAILAPVSARAKLNREGKLFPAGKVSVGRDVLEPTTGSGYVVGSVDDLDNFLTKNASPEAMVPDGAEDGQELENQRLGQWQVLLAYCEKMVQAMPRGLTEIEGGKQYIRLDNWFIEAVPDDGGSVSRAIVALYDHLLHHKPLIPLFGTLTKVDQGVGRECLALDSAFSEHLGHSHSDYPLAKAQRVAISHVLGAENGEVTAVNGPPGTGKTTMLLSVVASLWVRAAVNRGDPPVIVAASTNNQAVTNIIDAFGKDFSVGSGPFSGRWLPDISSFGVFVVSQAKRAIAAEKYQTQDFYSEIESEKYLEVAKIQYLRKAKKAYPDGRVTSVKGAVEAIHDHIMLYVKQLELLRGSWKELDDARYAMGEWDAKDLCEGIEKEILQVKKLIESKASDAGLYKRSIDEIDRYRVQEPWYMAALGILPGVRQQRLLRQVLAITNESIREELRRSTKSLAQVDDVLHKRLSAQRESVKARQKDRLRLEGLLEAQRKKRERLKQRLRDAQLSWSQQVKHINRGRESEGVDLSTANELADTAIRFPLFLLATHYWEGRWLLEMEATKPYLPEAIKDNGEAAQASRWRRRMMITPCLVSTFFTLPNHMKWWKDRREQGYLYNLIDLLVVDEAGQVLPDVAGASFALAKKALVVGDTVQIEPIYGVAKSIDYGNLVHVGLLSSDPEDQDIESLEATGKLASSGSVMAASQYVNHYHQHPGLARGLYLVEHRRCFDEIIQYCNDLCYQGALVPMRGALKEVNPALYLPAMGYMHVGGICTQNSSGSRVNQLEAQIVAAWVKDHMERLEAIYEKPIHEIVGVVTPFSGQKIAIRNALNKLGVKAWEGGADSVTVGTVHALQGAERPVVIFSAVYSKHSDGAFIDQSASMLNVAVSRAKDSFLVFGDMDLFNKDLSTPRGMLAQVLFSQTGNEIFPPMQQIREDLKSPAPTFLYEAEEHDQFLVRILESAKSRVLIVSPWLKPHRLAPFRSAFEDAGQRGVKVTIYTDISFNAGDDESAGLVIQQLKKLETEYEGTCVEIKFVRNVHSKVLAKDNDLICLGSFNWFSAVREPDGRFRNHEASIAYEGSMVAKEIEAHRNILSARQLQ